jgi:hypothetical protein
MHRNAKVGNCSAGTGRDPDQLKTVLVGVPDVRVHGRGDDVLDQGR